MSTGTYDERIAYHYAAYRPPLHELILGRVFEPNERFRTGLDVGCGVGYSTVALRRWCETVQGVDPNEAMLSRAIAADGVTYLLASGQALPVADGSIDVVTFAGSLYYARSPELLSELRRVCRPDASIVPYDFEVLIEEVMVRLGCEAKISSYDHSVNFAGDFQEVMALQEKLGLMLTSQQLAHVLLSSQRRYGLLSDMLQGDPFQALVDRLDSEGGRRPVGARLFYSRFKL